MKRICTVCSATLIVACILCTALIAMPSLASAKAKVVEVEGMSFNANASMGDNLRLLTGKKVYVSLKSGSSFAGTIKKVGNNLLHLEKLEGKDFFDALILIKDISAVDARFRAYQR